MALGGREREICGGSERATGRERNGIEEGEREIGGGGGEDDGRWRWGEMATGREWAVSDREVDRGLVKEN